MPAYDPSVIRQHAQILYAQASRIVLNRTLRVTIKGSLIGVFLALAFLIVSEGSIEKGLAQVAASSGPTGRTIVAVLGLLAAAIGGVGGYQQGLAESFMLRLEAQTSLCQVQIERQLKRLVSQAKSYESETHDE